MEINGLKSVRVRKYVRDFRTSLLVIPETVVKLETFSFFRKIFWHMISFF
jgi:hypothetical protein